MATKSKDLGGSVLASVSRSFYLSIRVLPKELRGPIGLAYLLARASDTIADSAGLATETRLHHLAAFGRMVRTGKPLGLEDLQRDIQTPHEGETVLIQSLDRCLQELAQTANKDRVEIVDVLQKIIRGQTLDLERFGGGDRIVALQNAGELEEYTYLVAGCVGEFWTRLCLHHLPDCASRGLAEMRQLGCEYGKGLQLVNILRDFPEDLANGRCYLPENELRAAGTSPSPVMDNPAKAQPVFNHWRDKAAWQLEHGYEYIAALDSPRLRIASFLPWHLGLGTLRLLGQPDALERTEKIKVSRNAVRWSLALGLTSAFSAKALDWSHRRAVKAAGFELPEAPTSEENTTAVSP